MRKILVTAIGILILIAGSFAFAQDRDLATVPSLTGKRVSLAKQMLRLRRLKAATGAFFISSTNWRDDIYPDVVYMQSVPAHQEIRADEIVGVWTFVKARNDQPIVSMPDLRDLTVATAMATAEELKLKVMMPRGAQTPIPESVIVDQYPRPGQTVYIGTGVLLLQSTKSSSRQP